MSRAETIVLAALPHVPFDGWTLRSLVRGAKDAGFDSAEVALTFPGGMADATQVFNDWANRQMTGRDEIKAIPRLNRRVEALIRARLEALEPHREAVRHIAAFLAMPQNAPLAMKLIYATVDRIWHEAGDGATDFSFYTKRLTLAGVYGLTLLCWLDDSSPGHADTWAFLSRRLEELSGIPKLRRRLAMRFKGVPSSLRRPFTLKRRSSIGRRAEPVP